MYPKYKSFIVPAGKYWLTDPSYLLSANPHDWLTYLANCNSTDVAAVAEDNINDTQDNTLPGHYEKIHENVAVLSFTVVCGKGVYLDQHGNRYCTDSGLLGLVPHNYNPEASLEGCGILVEFSDETLCFTAEGILTFGNYIIDTVTGCVSSDGTEL